MSRGADVNSGHYEEKLADGGKLRVFRDRWEIEYYFSGPDLRYTGDFVRFAGQDIPNLIAAYRSAYQRYQDLKKSAVPGAELILKASMNLTVRVGGYFDGVCLGSYHNPINSDRAFQEKTDAYATAIGRVPKIQDMPGRI